MYFEKVIFCFFRCSVSFFHIYILLLLKHKVKTKRMLSPNFLDLLFLRGNVTENVTLNQSYKQSQYIGLKKCSIFRNFLEKK